MTEMIWYNTSQKAGGSMNTRCYIAGAGDFYGGEPPHKGDYIIAADGGYVELVARGFKPNLIVGDFDSLGSVPQHHDVIPAPEDKDDTDMMLAVKHGLERGCTEFIINGALGGRFDHSLANIQVLLYISNRGARGVLVGRDICITTVTNGSIGFMTGSSGRVSVLCLGSSAEGVTLTGVKYPLDEAKLSGDYPVGVSNEFNGAPSLITVRSGTLLVMWSNGLEMLDGVV